MKKKKIWIPIVSLVLVAALGTGLALYFTRKPGKTVGVYDSNQLTMTYWGDEKTSSGPVTTDKLQTVFLSATQEVTKVNVQQGQKVKKGTVLLTYDTTLSQLSLDRKELDIQKTKLRLEDAKDQLADIKKMKPISYNDNTKPTTKPTTKPSTTSSGSVKPKEELGNKSFLELGGAGTAGDPKIFWVRQSQVFNDKFIAELLGEAKELYTILEVRRNDKAAGAIVSRTGVLFQAVEETVNTGSAVSTAFAQEGEIAQEDIETIFGRVSFAMTVEEAVVFFANQPKIARKLQTLLDVGLGYVTLGQSATTLSGGEAQRIKLATELSRRSTGKTIYILDEPTTGLHFEDVHKLVEILHRLADGGNTVVVIEHNLDVIKTADYIIDMGPEGGDRGGTVIAQGTPEEIIKVKKSYTGYYVKKMLEKELR